MQSKHPKLHNPKTPQSGFQVMGMVVSLFILGTLFLFLCRYTYVAGGVNALIVILVVAIVSFLLLLLKSRIKFNLSNSTDKASQTPQPDKPAQTADPAVAISPDDIQWRYCSFCGRQISPNARACPQCGEPTQIDEASEQEIDEPEQKPKRLISPFGCGLVVVLAFILVGFVCLEIRRFEDSREFRMTPTGKLLAMFRKNELSYAEKQQVIDLVGEQLRKQQEIRRLGNRPDDIGDPANLQIAEVIPLEVNQYIVYVHTEKDGVYSFKVEFTGKHISVRPQ